MRSKSSAFDASSKVVDVSPLAPVVMASNTDCAHAEESLENVASISALNAYMSPSWTGSIQLANSSTVARQFWLAQGPEASAAHSSIRTLSN